MAKRKPELLLIGVAVMHLRRDEVAPKPQGRFLVDFVGSGIDALATAINLFASARNIDPFDPATIRSSILLDVATFFAKVEEPGHIFRGSAKETALRVAGRLLRFEGWNAAAGYFGTWQDAVRAVDPTAGRVGRIAAYVRLFKAYWEPNGTPYVDVFDQYDKA